MALVELITHALAVGGGIAASVLAYGRAKTRAEVDKRRAAAAKSGRAATCLEDLCDKAASLAGFTTV